MTSTSLSTLDTGSATKTESTTMQPTTVLREIVTLTAMFLVTAAISLSLTLTWVL